MLPASSPPPRRASFTPEVTEIYKKKSLEFYTACVLRVYCVDCATFLPRVAFCNDDPDYTIAKCVCGANTCVGCKKRWDLEHCCDDGEGDIKPDWMLEYSEDCRIKYCPGCRFRVERKDACNHMTCTLCQHQFCFVCLVPYMLPSLHKWIHSLCRRLESASSLVLSSHPAFNASLIVAST
jgi:hypothetical protein